MQKKYPVLFSVFLIVFLITTAALPGGINDSGFKTSQPSMLTWVMPGVDVTPLLTVGDVLPSGYRYEAVPDGISLRTLGQGRVDLFINHETSKVRFPYNWVGYLGGVAKTVLTPPIAAGVAGAATATFFTFLPSFLFILAGGPLVEATRGELRFTAPLTAVTAAVVGVIFNLATFFAWHTFWPAATAAAPFSVPSTRLRSSSPLERWSRCGSSGSTS